MGIMPNQKRIHIPGEIYFVTCKTQNNYPYFEEEVFCKLWIEELRICKEIKECELYAFSLLLEHFHMMVKPGEKYNISKIMHCLKRNFSRDINKIINPTPGGEVPKPRREDTQPRRDDAPYCDNHRHDHPHGEDMDLRLLVLKNKFLQKYGTHHNFPPFQWQRSFYDHYIRDETDFENHYDYILNNPHKHGLGPKWKHTSKNFPGLLDQDW